MLLQGLDALPGLPEGGERTVIIGSGAVGLFLASELAKSAHADVLVLESGGTQLADFPDDAFSSVGIPHRNIRCRSLGGTTNVWGGQLVEFRPPDFEVRDWLPDSGWPIAYGDIEPHYASTYQKLGIPRDIQGDEAVWKAIGGRRWPDVEPEMFLSRWLQVPSFSIAFSALIRDSRNLNVLLGHTATGFEGSGERITHVKVSGPDGNTRSIAGSRFVLAAGTIESARLMLHGASTPGWSCPWRGNENLGRYFMDHLGGRVATVHPYKVDAFQDAFATIALSGRKFQPKLKRADAQLRQPGQLNVHGYVQFEGSATASLQNVRQFLKAAVYSRTFSGLGAALADVRNSFRYIAPLVWRYLVDNRIFVPFESRVSLIVQAEQAPIAGSRVTIDPEKRDARGVPRAILDWQVSGMEMTSIRDFAVSCGDTMHKAELARVEVEPALLRGDAGFLDSLRDTSHQAGGLRMGRDSADGVVDSDLKVFGTSNMYVAGASTFRTVSGANVTFTALAFANRLAQHLAH